MKKYLIILTLTLTLAGCFGGTTPPSQFYTLSPTITKPVSDQRLTVGVDRVQIPRSLDRPQMLTADADTPEMTLSELNRWVEPLPTLIQRTLITDLSTALPNAVIRNRSFSGEINDYNVAVDIVQLTAVLNDRAGLLAWLTVRTAAGQTVAHLKVAETVPIGVTYADMANGQSALIGRLASQIADTLATLPTHKKATR